MNKALDKSMVRCRFPVGVPLICDECGMIWVFRDGMLYLHTTDPKDPQNGFVANTIEECIEILKEGGYL